MMKISKRRLRREDGQVLLAAIICLVVLMGVTIGIMSQALRHGSVSEASYQLQRILYIAEAGVDAAAFELLQGGDGILGEQHFGGGYYTVTTYNLLETNYEDDDGDGDVDEAFETDAEGNMIMRITSVGQLNRDEEALEVDVDKQALEVDVKVFITETFDYVVMARGDINMTGNCMTNSYNSTQVDYPQQQLLGNGDVGTIGIGPGIIDVTGSAFVNGDAYVGVDGNPEADITVTGSASITGDEGVLQSEIELSSVVVPDFEYDEVGNIILKKKEKTLAPGNYYAPKLRLGSDAVLNLGVGYEGEINIVVDDFYIKSAEINIPGNVYVNIYVTNSLEVTAGAVINDPNGTDIRSTPSNLTILGTPTLAEAKFTAGSRTFAAIYLPDTDVTITGNTEIMGAIVASTLYVGQGDARIYLDEDLVMDMVDTRRVVGARCVSWREIASP